MASLPVRRSGATRPHEPTREFEDIGYADGELAVSYENQD
jgi:hypothetical protein